MSRTEEILAAIADALSGSRKDVVVVSSVIVGVAVLFAAAAIVTRLVLRGRRIRAFRQRYEREIRRLDLTILQLDVLDLLAVHLNEPAKKHILLTNEATFKSCRYATGKLAPPLDRALVGLEARLGFDGPAGVSLQLEKFMPLAGSAVKLEIPSESRRVLSTVLESADRRLRLKLESGQAPPRGTSVLLYAAHPSGLVVARAEVAATEKSEVWVTIARPFAEPSGPQQLDNVLRVFVRSEGRASDAVPTEVRQLWSAGAVLDNPDKKFRKGDDLQIVLRRNHARWVVVNAEVVRLRRRRSLMRVRFSHLSRDARMEILGRPAER